VMNLTSDQIYVWGLDFFSEIVQQVSEDQWMLPSPCKGWRALDVLGHVGAATSTGTSIMRGNLVQRTWPEQPGEAVEWPPGQWWAELVDPARQAVAEADLDAVVDSPLGPRVVSEGLAFPSLDLFIHAWDLASSIGAADRVEIPDEVIEFARPVVASVPHDVLRSPSVFGPTVTVGPDATRSQAFLAWTGRDPA